MKPAWNGKDVSDPLGFFISGVYCSTKHEINYYAMINAAFRTWKCRKVPPVFSTSYNPSASPNGVNTDFFFVWSSLAFYGCWWWYVLSLSRVRRSVRSAYHSVCFPAGLSESYFLILKMCACLKFHLLLLFCLFIRYKFAFFLSHKSRLLQNLRRVVALRTFPLRSIDRISFPSTLAW